jgi:hypothetical protein
MRLAEVRVLRGEKIGLIYKGLGIWAQSNYRWHRSIQAPCKQRWLQAPRNYAT